MRVLLGLVLSVLLAFASQSEAVARSEMAGASDQVLCGASGTLTLTLDAQGQPVHIHPCTHCLAASVVAGLAAAVVLPQPQTRAHRQALPRSAQPARRMAPVPSARGPPAFPV
jgi:hypothetical protein